MNLNEQLEQEISTQVQNGELDTDEAVDEQALLASAIQSLADVDNNVNKLENLKDIQEEVLNQNAISKNTAEYVHASFENIFNGYINPREFTMTPTKTNFEYVKKQMAIKIAKEQATLVTNFQLLIDNPLSDAKTILETISSSYLPSIRESAVVNRALAVTLKERLDSIKNSVYPCTCDGKQSFVDLKTLDISTYDIGTINDLKGTPLASALISLKEIVSCKYFKAFILASIDGKDFKEISDRLTIATYSDSVVTVRHLIELYNLDLDEILEDIYDTAEDSLESLEDIQKESDTFKQDPESIEKYLIEKSGDISNHLKDTGYMLKLTHKFSALNLVSKTILSTFSEM
jgi:hypothetical protein